VTDVGDSTLTGRLFSEEIVEGCARIQNPADDGSTGVVGLAFNRCSGNKEVARIPDVLLGYAFRDGLGAFKLGACIKITAVLACSEVCPTFRTCAFQADLNWGRDDSPAHGAAQNLLKTRHMHRARAIPFLPFWGTGLRLSGANYAVAAVVLISTLSVFSFGHLWLTTLLVSGRLQAPGQASNFNPRVALPRFSTPQ
jgi:hypothetical protein